MRTDARARAPDPCGCTDSEVFCVPGRGERACGWFLFVCLGFFCQNKSAETDRAFEVKEAQRTPPPRLRPQGDIRGLREQVPPQLSAQTPGPLAVAFKTRSHTLSETAAVVKWELGDWPAAFALCSTAKTAVSLGAARLCGSRVLGPPRRELIYLCDQHRPRLHLHLAHGVFSTQIAPQKHKCGLYFKVIY